MLMLQVMSHACSASHHPGSIKVVFGKGKELHAMHTSSTSSISRAGILFIDEGTPFNVRTQTHTYHKRHTPVEIVL